MKGHDKQILRFLTDVETAEKTSYNQYSQRNNRRYYNPNHREHPQNAIKIDRSEIKELWEIKNITDRKNSVERLEENIEGNILESQVKRQRSRK